jgi:ABC-type cobalamin/Fe3+-siderophores transport system ATPase subunit
MAAWTSYADLPAGLTVLVGEHGCGTTTLLRALHDPPHTVLLSQPPGDEWSDHDLATHAFEAPHLLGREYWTLSGGERQRVRLGTALSQDGVLLLDEPLGYLDDRAVAAVLDGLAGRTALVVCKSDPRAWARADRLLELADGRLTPVSR